MGQRNFRDGNDSMIVKVGDPIQLNLQLEGGETDKFPLAILRDSDGNELSESPRALAHVGDGLYSNDDILMPNFPEVTATYKVYDDEDHLTLTDDYSFSIDEFHRSELGAFLVVPEIEVFIEDEDELNLDVEDDGEISVMIEDEDELKTEIEVC